MGGKGGGLDEAVSRPEAEVRGSGGVHVRLLVLRAARP